MFGFCAAGTPQNCNDNNPCTLDPCLEPGGCFHFPAAPTFTCNDNNACTLNDMCDGAGGCSPGTTRVCDDGSECTTDTCNMATGCVFTPRTGTCTDDGTRAPPTPARPASARTRTARTARRATTVRSAA
jgi:hypothetical protein